MRGVPRAASAATKPARRRKLSPEDYAARFEAEKALQQRRYCNAFKLWQLCALRACRRRAACGGDAKACLKRALDAVPHAVQWQARHDILEATPLNLGAPERAARQSMPRDLVPSATAKRGRGTARSSRSERRVVEGAR